MWFLQVFESLGISWQMFVSQAGALALWVCVAAVVFAVVETVLMRFDDHQMAMLTAFVVWALFGIAGAHRIYFGRIETGLAQLALTTVAALSGIYVGTVPLLGTPIAIFENLSPLVVLWLIFAAAILIWIIRDALLIPGWVREEEQVTAAAGQAST